MHNNKLYCVKPVRLGNNCNNNNTNTNNSK